MYNLSIILLNIRYHYANLPFITPIMTVLFSTCCPNSNTLICKLDALFNGKTSLWEFLHTLRKTKWYIKSFCCIFYNIIENHP